MVAQIDGVYFRTRPGKLWSRVISYALFEGRPLTTRGRWINPMVFAGFGLECRLPQLRSVDRPVFILGTGRSGTTILGLVLSMHRDVGFLNEPKAIWHKAHGAEDLIGNYSCGRAHYRLDADDATPTVTRIMHRIYAAYLCFSGTRRVVDKYPELTFRMPFVKAIFPDAQALFLARNGWDTCASIDNWSDRHGKNAGAEVHDWWGADRRKWRLLISQIVPEHPDLCRHAAEMADWTDQRAMAAVEWIVTMREGLALTAAHPEQVMHVTYENLAANPSGELSRIARFLDLRTDPRFESYGCKVLASTKPHPRFALPTCLEGPFARTMAELGYDATRQETAS